MSNPTNQNMDHGSKYTRAVVMKTGYLVVIDQTLANQLNFKRKTLAKNALNYLTSKPIDPSGELVLLYKAVVKLNKELREHAVLLKFDGDTESAIKKFLQSDEHKFPLCKHMREEAEKSVPTPGAKRAGICDRGECKAIAVGDLMTEFLNHIGGSIERQNAKWKKFFDRFKPTGEFVVLDSSAPLEFVRNSAKYLTEPRKIKLTRMGDSNGTKIDAFTLREYKKSFGENIKNGLRPLMLQGARKAVNRDFIEQTIGHSDMDALVEWRDAINDLLVAQDYNANLFETYAKRLKELKGIKSERKRPNSLGKLKDFEDVGPLLKRENPIAQPGLDFETVTGSFKTSLSLNEALKALFPAENNTGLKHMLESNFLGSYKTTASEEDVLFQEYVVPPMDSAVPSSQYGPEKQISYLRAASTLNFEPKSQNIGFFASMFNFLAGAPSEPKSYSRRFDISKSYFSKTNEVNIVYKGVSAVGGFVDTQETKLPGGSSASFKEITLNLSKAERVLSKEAQDYEDKVVNTPTRVTTKSITELLETGWFKGTKDEARLQLLSYVEKIVSSDIYHYWFALSLRQLCFQLVDAVVASLAGVTKMSIVKPALELFYDMLSIKFYEDSLQQLAMNDIHNYTCAGFLKAVDSLFSLNKTSVFGLEAFHYALCMAERLLQPNHVTNKTFIPSAGSSMLRYFEISLGVAKGEVKAATNIPTSVTRAMEKAQESLKKALAAKEELDLLFQTRAFLSDAETIKSLQAQVDEYVQTKSNYVNDEAKARKADKVNRRRQATLERFGTYFVLYNKCKIRVKYDVTEKRFKSLSAKKNESDNVDLDIVRVGINKEAWENLVPINTLDYEGAQDIKEEYLGAAYHGDIWFQVHEPKDFLSLESIRVNNARTRADENEKLIAELEAKDELIEADIDEVDPEELVEKSYFELFEGCCSRFKSSFTHLSAEYTNLNQIYDRKISKAIRKEVVANSRKTMPSLLEQVNKNLYEIIQFFHHLPEETVEVKYYISAHAKALLTDTYFNDFDFNHSVGQNWFKSIVSGLKKGFNEGREQMSTKIGEDSTVANIYNKSKTLAQERNIITFKEFELSEVKSDEFVKQKSNSYLNAAGSKKKIEGLKNKSKKAAVVGREVQRIQTVAA
eukprot:augustus_masked-scaffold_8-processed-gene-10.8-mRNA-1 protein AED:1.00 eAED:1.00 QI:0/-1/0/0/-1/1/1/0/1132